MLAAPKIDILFMNNPHTGGHVIEASLQKFADLITVGVGYSSHTGGLLNFGHLTAMDADFHFDSYTDNTDLGVVGFVRDPYSRFVAAMLHLRQHYPEFASVSQDTRSMLKHLNPSNISSDYKLIGFCPQWRFFLFPDYFQQLADQDGPESDSSILATDLYRYEFIDAEMRRMTNDLGFCASEHMPIGLPRVPEPTNEEEDLLGELLNDSFCLTRMFELYGEDFTLFGYPSANIRTEDLFANDMRDYAILSPFWRTNHFPEGPRNPTDYELEILRTVNAAADPLKPFTYLKHLFREVPNQQNQGATQ